MKYGKNKRYSNSIERTFEIKLDKPVMGLRIVKVLSAVLLIAVVVGVIMLGSYVYRNRGGSESTEATSQTAESSADEELLRLVNKTHSLEKSYVPKLVKHKGYSVSTLCDKELKKLLSAAEKEGITLDVESAYISYDEQKKLYKQKYSYFRKSGKYTQVRAQAKTEAIVPKAGNSEAQTGLLVIFKTNGMFEGSKASRWLRDNCVNYGFILRYPADKADATSMEASEKAFRYVGKDYAMMMRSLNKTLDEYVVYLNSR